MTKQNLGNVFNSLKFFGYAFRGIYQSLISERNIRIHWIIAAVITILGVYKGLSITEWCLLFLFFALVIATEMINTALENLVDIISPEYSLKAGKIKDISSGAVLVTAIFAIVAGCFIFIPKFFA